MGRVMGFTWTVADHELLSSTDPWGDTLVEIAREDPRVVAVTADLGTTTKLARMRRELPARTINVGVAEQNLIAVAAGLAASGLVPVVCTYATFAALRAAEFVRTDVAYNARNVKIIGTLAGVAFGQGGPTHHSVEDIALMRAIPGMTVLSPRDGLEMCDALRAAIAHDGPVYIRYGRGTEAPIRGTAPFAIGRAETLCAGSAVAILATGATVEHAVRAHQRLATLGVSARVVALSSLKPLDAAAVIGCARETKAIVTVEDHNIIGGLGGAVCEVVAAEGIACKVHRLGHPDRWLGMGVPEDLMHAGEFDEDAIVETVAALVGVAVPQDDEWGEAW
jgi:transketolase